MRSWNKCEKPKLHGVNFPEGGFVMNRRLHPLCENHLFTKAFTRGATCAEKHLAVYVLKNTRKAPDGVPHKTQTGIAVNAKLGKSAKRNRVKRIVRAGMYPLYDRLSDGLFVVISPRGAAFSKKVRSYMLEKELDACFTKLGAYKGMELRKREDSGAFRRPAKPGTKPGTKPNGNGKNNRVLSNGSNGKNKSGEAPKNTNGGNSQNTKTENKVGG